MLILYVLLFSSLWAKSDPPSPQYTCAFATGFPPYQFVTNNKPDGLDIKIFHTALDDSITVSLSALAWRDAVAQLEFGVVDCVLGMEMSSERLQRFTFTPPLYHRKIRIFVPDDSNAKSIEDLHGKIVANDRGSELFKKLKKEKLGEKLRLLDVSTKAEAFELMKKRKVSAMIGPLQVIKELSRKNSFKVREISGVGVDVPVAIAFKKTEHPLLVILKNNILRAKVSDKISKLIE